MKSGNLCLILGVLVIALLLPNPALAAWRTECVDCPRYFTGMESRSLALDSSGNPHIVYGGSTDGIYYAYYDGGSWHIETVNSIVASYNSVAIAIDSLDKVHISYGSSSSGLKYATNASGSWVTEIVDSEAGAANSIAIDSLDKVHISYGSGSDLKYATNASGSWVIQTVDSDRSGGTSIAVDSSDKVHISYGYYSGYPDFSYSLRYATNASGTWVTETIDSDGRVGQNNSIAIDSSDKVHISYYDGSFPDYDLKYATNASGSWVTEIVDSNGGASSIAIDSSDNVHISYSSDQALMHMTNASGSWVTEIVDSNGGGVSSIAIDSSDNVHISYVSSINYKYDLKYALNSSGSWVIETVDRSRRARQNASVAIDSADNVHITYVSDQGLMYMTNASGSWVTEIADSNGGWDPSIAVDSSGKAHVVFTTSNNYNGNDLKYATNASGLWVTEILDSSAKGPSIAIDSSGKAHVSYSFAVDIGYGVYFDFYLRYATNAPGSWVIQTVDRWGGLDTSITMDSSDKVHIGYSEYAPYSYGGAHYNLKYATNASGLWVTEILDFSFVWNPSIAIDSSGNMYIAYSFFNASYDPANNDVRYATNASGSWVVEILDEGGNIYPPANPSIAIDSSDNVHISYSYYYYYYDYPNSDLKYATNASGSWVTEKVDSDGFNPSMAMDSSDNVYIVYYDYVHSDLKYATNKPLPEISVTDSVDPADDLLISFGEVRGNRPLRQTATVTNTGSADLVVREVYLTGRDPEQFDIRNDDCSNTVIAPSGSCTIEVVFRPAGTGVFDAKLGIDSNDPDTPELYVELTGTGVAKRKQGRNNR